MEKIKMVISILLLALYLVIHPGQAQTFDLGYKLKARNDYQLSKIKLYKYLFDTQVYGRLEDWANHPANNSYMVECQYKLRPFINSPKVLLNLCYFYRQDDPKKRSTATDFLNYYLNSVKLALEEIADDPKFSENQKNNAKLILNHFYQGKASQVVSCFNPGLKVDWTKAIVDGKITYSPFQMISSCLRQLPLVDAKMVVNGAMSSLKMPFFSINLTLNFDNNPGHVISETGWIPGNQVTYLNKNDYGATTFSQLKPKRYLVQKNYPLEGAGSLDAFFNKEPHEVFTEAEGFFPVDQHPVWTQSSGIFKEIITEIRNAQDSIFIDLFFFGGTMGVNIAQNLIKQLESKPNLKVLILRDNVNHLTYDKDMKPVFNFLLSYSLKHPDRLIIMPSHIVSHLSGLPSYMSPLVNDQFLRMTGLNSPTKASLLPIHMGVKSDHSKVVVIDAKGERPVAFVGSKNWVDSSGALCYDDVGKVVGPGALVVQDDYYFDMFYAMKYEIKEKIINHWASNGWSKSLYNQGQSVNQMIVNILKPFDLLNRNAFGQADQNIKVEAPIHGNTMLRTGMTNVNSSVTNTLEENIQNILFAQKSIYINDQYTFDRNIISALLMAKKKRPNLDIKLILEPVIDSPIPGMPNLLFADELKKAGIQLKFKKKVGGDEEIRQEYHMKTLSIDGKFVIVGSANKDMNTMWGSFREEQFDIFDAVAAGVHDKTFIERWNSPTETSEVFEKFTFKLPDSVVGFDGKPMTPETFIKLIRVFVSVLYDSVVR